MPLPPANPAKTIKDLIEAQWVDANVNSRVAKANITFTTGRAQKGVKGQASPKFMGKRAIIEVFPIGEIIIGLSKATSKQTFNKALHQVSCWVSPTDVSQTAIDNAVDDVWTAGREIIRIIRNFRDTMTEIKFGFPTLSRPLIDLESDNYATGVIIEVEVFTFETN